ncbi:MAG: A24 family peptidase [Pseudomonadota bacterium]
MTETLAALAALPSGLQATIGAIFGLLTGSFLNVVIYRLPVRMQYEWSQQSYEWLNEKEYPEPAPPGIVFPASHCQQCKTPIKPWHNIPVISFLILRGRCTDCGAKIGIRYPLVELFTAILSGLVIYQFGFTLQGVAGLIITWALITLSFIDIDHKLLPDDIVIPLMWLGLAASLLPVFASSNDALIGAIAGYLSFWIVFQLFKLLTGKEGMGFGDFKLMAMLGAWLGWLYLPQIILISTFLGSLVGITMMLAFKQKRDAEIPFGPYIALAGWIALLWGEQINQGYLNFVRF